MIPTLPPSVRSRAAAPWGAVCAFVCLLAAWSPAVAQTTSSALNGVVKDSSEQPVAGAIVQARSEENGAVRTAVSGRDGEYRMASVSPGRWIVAVRLPDGTTSAARTVDLRLQETVRLDFVAEGGVAERVTVTAEAPLVDRRETGGKLRVSSERPTSSRACTTPSTTVDTRSTSQTHAAQWTPSR